MGVCQADKAGGAGERHSSLKEQHEQRHSGMKLRVCWGSGDCILVVLLELVPDTTAGERGRGGMMRGNRWQGASQKLTRGEHSLRESLNTGSKGSRGMPPPRGPQESSLRPQRDLDQRRG